jgi:hypothetical protein
MISRESLGTNQGDQQMGKVLAHARSRACLNARILPQLTPDPQRIGSSIGDAVVMDTTRMYLAQATNAPGSFEQEPVFQQGPHCLAAIKRVRFSRVVGAREGALGVVMTNREATGGRVSWTASAGDVVSNGHACQCSP